MSVNNVVPFFVARLSALAVGEVHGLRTEALCTALTALLTCDAEIAARRDSASQALYAAIGRQKDRRTRNTLLELRRRLYNGRFRAADIAGPANDALDVDARNVVREFERLLLDREDLQRRLLEEHTTSLRASRASFRHLLGKPCFRNGLLLSSPTLFGNLSRYCAVDPDHSDSRTEQIERGLLRYATRCAMKATPFATFCTIVPGEFHGLDDDRVSGSVPGLIDGFLSPQISYIRLDKSLYGLLWAHLKRRPAVRRALTIDLNPTLHDADGRWVFLAGLGDREVFQRIVRNEAIDLIHKVVREQRAVSLGGMIARLMSDPAVEASEDEAAAYLESLLQIGFLRFRAAVADQVAEWDVVFRQFLEQIDDDHARIVVDLLGTLRTHLDTLVAADTEQRVAEIAHMREAIRDALEALAIRQSTRNVPVYEDATANARVHLVVDAHLRDALRDLAEFVARTQPIAYPRASQSTMRHFYDTYYGVRDAVPLLKFYEDFFREHLKEHIEKEQKIQRGARDERLKGYDVFNPFGLEHSRAIRTAQTRLAELFREAWSRDPNAEEISVAPQALAAAVADVPETRAVRSASVFCQVVPSNGPAGPARIVLPNGTYYAGYGKYFSRFLYLLPDDLLQRTREANAVLTEDMLVEISGDAHFNANLHPPMLECELGYPTGECGSPDGQLACTDLEVTHDVNDTHALALRHRESGRHVQPIDLGFLSPMRRPPLYQLLSRFMPAGTFSVTLPESQVAPQAPQPMASSGEGAQPWPSEPSRPTIMYRPRMTYGQSVVIARRRWTFAATAFPGQQPGESGGEYFIRLNRWRSANDIPLEVYARIRPVPVPHAARQGQGSVHDGAGPAKGEPSPDHQAPVPQIVDALVESDEQLEDATEPAADPEAEPTQPPEAVGDGLGPAATDADDIAHSADPGGRDEPKSHARSPGSPSPPTPARPMPSRDWWKPQYIDFANPMLVRLFAKLPGVLTHFIMHLEERYPDTSALPESDHERYSSEFILQYSFPASATTSETQLASRTNSLEPAACD